MVLELLTRTELFVALREEFGGLGTKPFNALVPYLPKVHIPGLNRPKYRYEDVLRYIATLPSLEGTGKPLHRHRGRPRRFNLPLAG